MKKTKYSKFVMKLLVIFCAITIVAIGVASYFVLYNSAQIVTETEAKFEKEINWRMLNDLDAKIEVIRDIFSRIYISEVIINGKNIRVVDAIKNSIPMSDEQAYDYSLSSFLRLTAGANAFIRDIMLLDYNDQKVYFVANSPSRNIVGAKQFYESAFAKEVMNSERSMSISNVYQPEYYNLFADKSQIISIYINLYNAALLDFTEPVGALIINIDPYQLGKTYKEFRHEEYSRFFVVNENGYVYYDSQHAYTGRQYPKDDYGGYLNNTQKGRYLVYSCKSQFSNLYCVNVVDRQSIYKDVFWSQIPNVVFIMMVSLGVIFLLSFLVSTVFSRRISHIVRHIGLIENGIFNQPIQVSSRDELMIIEKSLNKMCETIVKNMDTIVDMQVRTKEAELRSLQAQINPHFMFNTLESIRAMAIFENDRKVAKMIHILGNMFRWNIKTKRSFVLIEEEIDYIESYLELQRIRLRDSFSYKIDLEDATKALSIPKLILQPLIENALSHGFAGRDNGTLLISSHIENDKLVLTITDNGNGMDVDTINKVMDTSLGNGSDIYNIGIQNVMQRISLLFGPSYGMKIESEPGNGTKVILYLPNMTIKEMERYVSCNYS